MKKYVDGKYIEMTEEEIAKVAEMEKMNELVAVEPTVLERLEAIEAAILEGVLMDG